MAHIEIRSNDDKIITAAEDLRQAKALIKVAKEDETKAREILLAFMQACKAEKLTAGKNVVRLTAYERTTIDTVLLKQEHPQFLIPYETKVTMYRLTVGDA